MKTQVAFIPIFMLIYAGLPTTAAAQNLVPNPSFETYTQCPIGFGPGGPLDAPPWQSATEGTIDYFHPCSNPSDVGVPDNAFGSQAARTGLAYAGGYFNIEETEYREYLLVQLTQPLLAGRTYHVSYYVSLAEIACGIHTIGVLFTPEFPVGAGSGTLNYTPQIETTIGYISDTTNWVYIQQCFTAEGGEEYMTIGNFHNFFETMVDPLCPNATVTSYYYIDDVSVIESPPGDIPFDLGEPVTVCDSFEIDPDLDGVNYFWANGSNNPSLTVTTSGTYSLTVSRGCESGVDAIDVTVNNPVPVEIGPEEYTMCSGDVFTISLDPDAGMYTWNDGSTDPVYNITSGGVYQVTLDDGCDLTTAEVTVITIDEPEAFSLGADTVICEGAEIEYYFDPSLGQFEWQDNSNGNTYVIQEAGIYSLMITNMCGEEIDEIEVTIASSPTVSLGPDQVSVCEGDTIDVQLVLDPAIGMYAWQDGSTFSTYQISSAGLYSVTVTNGCGVAADTLNVVQVETPVVNFDTNLSLCPGDTITLHGNGLSGNYLWQDNATGTEYAVTSPGEYSLTITNVCGTATDSVIVNDLLPPAIALPDQLALCDGFSEELDPGISGAVYTWSDGSQGPTLIVNAAGTYSLTVTNGCGVDMDTITILDGGPAPVVSLGPDVSICTGDVLDINPLSSNVLSWLWSDGSDGGAYTTSSAGPVYVEAANGCGVAYDTMMVTVIPLTPTLSLGPDILLCPGTTQVLTISEPGVDIQWSDGSTGTSFQVTDAEFQVYAMITNGCGHSADTVEVSLLPATPILYLGNDQALCPGEAISFDPDIAGVTYLWQDGSTGDTFQTTQEGTVILTISDFCGSSTDTVVVTESTDSPQLDLGPDVIGCAGETIAIPAGISGVSYLWQDGSTGDEFLTAASGWIYLTVHNLCGTDTDSVFVDLSEVAPAPDLGADTTLCEGTTFLLASGSDAITSIEWQDGSSAPTFLVTSPGLYSLTASNQCGSATDDINIMYMPLPSPFSLGLDTSICPGQSVELAAPQTTNALVWHDGTTQPVYIANKAQTYYLHISNACGVVSDTLVVSMNPVIPLVNLTANKRLCPGDELILNVEQPFAASYLWNTGDVGPSLAVSSPGIYSVEVSGPCNTAFAQVEVIPMRDCGDEEGIFIPNVFSPNDDQVNDKFTLSFGDDVQVISIEGSIYNRWGNVMYTSGKMPFEWDGRFNGEVVMPGVFVYQVQVKYIAGGEERSEVFKGDVTVLK